MPRKPAQSKKAPPARTGRRSSFATSASERAFSAAADDLYARVRALVVEGRRRVFVAADTALVATYWNVGREIVEQQGGAGRSAYGDRLVDNISHRLTAEFGRGFTRVNLFYMRRFYLAFPNVHTLSEQLSWSHYRALIAVGDEAVLWGDPADGDPAVEEWAAAIGTINYEVVARVGRSVERRTT